MNNHTKQNSVVGDGSMASDVQAIQSVPTTRDEEFVALHSKLAGETLRADQGWQRYVAANAARNRAEADIAQLQRVVIGHSRSALFDKLNKIEEEAEMHNYVGIKASFSKLRAFLASEPVVALQAIRERADVNASLDLHANLIAGSMLGQPKEDDVLLVRELLVDFVRATHLLKS